VQKNCQHINHRGDCCSEPELLNGFCFWHSRSVDKNIPDLKLRLEAYARSGRSMSGFQLARTDLSGLDLVNHGSRQGFDLSYADLYHANLSGAHLYKLNLSHSSLMKADFHEANLNEANLSDCNLLGVNLKRSKLANVHWGRVLRQERLALQARGAERRQLNDESEEVYRNLCKTCEGQGYFEEAGEFFFKEMQMRRLKFPLNDWHRYFFYIIELFSGYGERPLRVIMFSLLVVFGCALLYYFLGIQDGSRLIQYQEGLAPSQIVADLRDCVYYSVVTFTTLGYGDIVPIGNARILASIEAFVGSFSIALFVVVFVKKMAR